MKKNNETEDLICIHPRIVRNGKNVRIIRALIHAKLAKINDVHQVEFNWREIRRCGKDIIILVRNLGPKGYQILSEWQAEIGVVNRTIFSDDEATKEFRSILSYLLNKEITQKYLEQSKSVCKLDYKSLFQKFMSEKINWEEWEPYLNNSNVTTFLSLFVDFLIEEQDKVSR